MPQIHDLKIIRKIRGKIPEKFGKGKVRGHFRRKFSKIKNKGGAKLQIFQQLEVERKNFYFHAYSAPQILQLGSERRISGRKSKILGKA